MREDIGSDYLSNPPHRAYNEGVAKCPECGVPLRSGRHLVWSGLPRFRCESCGEDLQWNKRHLYAVAFISISALALPWWLGGTLMFSSESDEPQFLLWFPWTWLWLCLFALSLNRFAALETPPEP